MAKSIPLRQGVKIRPVFNPLTATIVTDLIAGELLPAAPRAVDLGNQTYGVDRLTMERIIARLEGSPAADRRRINHDALRSFAKAEIRGPAAPTVEQFYRALGFAGYEAIDINSRYGSLVMDLNRDLEAAYGFTKTYDLVVNTGTAEHVFNQAAFLRNAHTLAKPGGLMVHIVPFTGYINHGFYNYQPNLFLDLAAANRYELVRLDLADRNEVLGDLTEPGGIATHFLPHLGLMAGNEKGNTFIVAVLRKGEAREFVHPCQGKYIETLEGKPLTDYYGGQSLTSSARSRPDVTRPGGAGRGSRAFRTRKKLKKALLRYLRGASRFVLLRL